MVVQGASTPVRVLVLEDNDHDTELMLRALQRGGFEAEPVVVETESRYREALQGEFDLILADFSLNGFDALRALEILREEERDLPFIIVTGTVGEDVVVECMRLGASDYLLKDRLARLGEAVKRALRAHALREENRQAELELIEAREQAQRDYDALLGRLSELAEQVGLANDTNSVYRALFDFCNKSTPADGIFVARFDPETGLRSLAYSCTVVGDVSEEHDVTGVPALPLNSSPQSQAIRSGEVFITGDLPAYQRSAGLVVYEVGSEDDAAERLSSVAVPLKVQGRTIGAFEVQSGKLNAFAEPHVVALTMAANHAAIALENVALLEREREQRRAAELSESRYRELVDQASDGIVVFDGQGEVRQANPMLRRMLGLDPLARKVGNISQWLAPRDLATDPLAMERLQEGGTVLNERLLRRADGGELPVETNTRRLDQETFQSIIRDISERKRAERELVAEKVFSDTVINSLPGIFYLFDEEFRLIRWNRNLDAVSGYGESEIARMSPLDFFAEEQRGRLEQSMRTVLSEGVAEGNARLLTREGHLIPYFFSSVRLVMNGQSYVMGTGLDVTSQQEAEARERELNLELEKRLARLSALHEVDMAITGSVDLRLTLNVLLDKVLQELGVDASSIWVYEKSNQELSRLVAKGLPAGRSRESNTQLGSGTVGRCGLERKTIRLSREELASRGPIHGVAPEFADYLALPLVSKGQLQGVLEVFNAEQRELDEDRLEFLEALALQTAIAIDNVLLFQGLERSTIDLTLAYDATIEGWARALDMRDHETEGHSRRVTELTVALSRHMGVAETELAHIRRGALLHDIGKLGVPDAILMKPGPLSDEERKAMQRHARLGYELLAPIAFLRPAIEIPYCHHEAWDGGGYPRGLVAEEIPLAARIFAVSDVYDALTSDRPYRGAWSEERAREYVRERSGKQFDPRVVEAFLELQGERQSGSESDGG